MFPARRRPFVTRTAVICGLPICVLFGFLLLISSAVFDDSRPVIAGLQSKEPSSRIELVQRELLNDNNYLRLRYDNQDFVSKTSEIAHKVFDIAPDIQVISDNDTELYQVDYPGEISSSALTTTRYIFVLHHYEQLGKATENLLQLCAMAKQMNRVVVEPFVRDSRMCGLPGGWYGEQRSKSRLFRPFSTYFNVELTNKLLLTSGYGALTDLATFKQGCSAKVAKTTLVHFIYDSDAEESLRKWYGLSYKEYQQVMISIKDRGYCDCKFINSGLNVSQRIGDVQIGRQICVNPEKIRSIDLFENKVLLKEACVAIIHWRGFGKDRTHFQPNVTVKPWQLVQSLQFSDVILKEVDLFKEVSFLNKEKYISIHIRSERQLQWYGVEKLTKCVKVMVGIVEKLKKKLKISKVFLSTDLSAFGSDTLVPYANQDSKLHQNLIDLQRMVVEKLKPLMFSPRSIKDPVLSDKGVVAIIEMNLLFGGSQLVTLGSGTFQQWIMDVFINHHSKDETQDWTVTRVCSKEEKSSLKI